MDITPRIAPDQDEFGEDVIIDLKKYFYLFWDKAWLILLASVLAAAAAYFVSIRLTPVYQADATVLIEVPSFNTTEVSAITAAERLTRTYSEIMTNTNVLMQMIDRLGMSLKPTELKDMIIVQPQPNTQLIDIKVESTDPEAAAVIANTLVDVFAQEIVLMHTRRYQNSLTNLENQMMDVEAKLLLYKTQLASAASQAERDRLESKIAENQGIYAGLLRSYETIRLTEAQSMISVILIEPAFPPQIPTRPRVRMNSALAALSGLIISSGGIFLAEALDDRLKTPDEITDKLNLPVLGLIDSHDIENGNKLISAAQPRSPITEEYRTLRTNVNFASVDHRLRCLLITSAEPGEGKSTIAANLAVVLAQSGLNTGIIDCDLRKPSIHTFFGLNNYIGLTSLFKDAGNHHIKDFWQKPFGRLEVLTSGPLPPNPSEILGSQRMKKVLEMLRKEFDILVIDSPPVLAVTDAVVLAQLVDGVLLVVQPGKTKLKTIQTMLKELRLANANILGVAIKFMGGKSGRRYSRRYGYYNREKYDHYYQAGVDNSEPHKHIDQKDFDVP